MPRLNNHIASFLLLALLSLNCADPAAPSSDTGESKEIIPLAVGYSWTYHVELHDTGGRVYASFPDGDIVRGDSTIDDQVWYYEDPHGKLFTNKSDGFYNYDFDEPESSRVKLVYKYPFRVGDKYSEWEVIKRDTLIIVPAGAFNCILYTYRLKTSYSFNYTDAYVAPGVGKIKEVQYRRWVDNTPIHTERIYLWAVSELTSRQVP